MRLSHFFIDRPIFASVIAIILTLVGAGSYSTAVPFSDTVYIQNTSSTFGNGRAGNG